MIISICNLEKQEIEEAQDTKEIEGLREQIRDFGKKQGSEGGNYSIKNLGLNLPKMKAAQENISQVLQNLQPIIKPY